MQRLIVLAKKSVGGVASTAEISMPSSATVGDLALQVAEHAACEASQITLVRHGAVLGQLTKPLQEIADEEAPGAKITVVYLVRKAAPAATPAAQAAATAAASASGAKGGKVDPDYAEEGRKLLEAVHLQSEGAPTRYSHIDPLWRHPQTGAVMYVGSAKQAQDRESLRKYQIARIVNCQDNDGDNYFEGDPGLMYLRFTIGRWRGAPGVRDGGEGTWRFWEPLFTFVTDGLRQGDNVFIHCLAGAHRAGTAAIGLLMLLCHWDARTAIPAAKMLRPAICPIGAFPELLGLLEQARVGREHTIQILLPEEKENGESKKEEGAA